MLAAELLVTRARGDEIAPAFIEPGADHLELARDLIGTFTDHTGKRLGELYDILEEVEDQGFDYRLVRGLVSLLERRSDMQVESEVDPAEARREVFAAAARSYPVTTAGARTAAIRAAADTLGTSPDAIEQAMYADLESQLVMRSFRPPAPDDLLFQYNLSLAQTLLFKATRLEFRATAGHKAVLRHVKRLGLMYDASYASDDASYDLASDDAAYDASTDGCRVCVAIDGPSSALKLTERYGTSFARLLPFIVASPGWSLEASIVRKDYAGNPRVYRFAMSERKHGDLFGSPADEPVTFDSALEESFYDSMAGPGTGWSVRREPEPLIAGKSLFIPDFLLEKDGMKVYVEIAGFWTPEYLRRKVAKLKEIRGRNLIVLADAKLSCEAFREVPGVIFYEKKVPAKPVLDRLRALERASAQAGAARIDPGRLRLDGPAVPIAALADQAGVSADAMRLYLGQHMPPGFQAAGDELISDGLLRELRGELPETMPYAAAVAAIRKKGVNAADTVIKMLGYAVKWSGLDPDSAVVYRTK